MSNSITAAVSESFELTVSPSEGFTGEHNAEMLEINISPLTQGGYDYYVIIFDDMSVNGVRKSNEIRGNEDYPAYLENETVFCPLSSQLTSTGKLKIQIEAHKLASGGSLIKKTSVASLGFKPSIMSGSDNEFDSSSASRLDNIEYNIKNLEAQLEKLSTIPLATTESIGGIKLSTDSPVQLDENGAADLRTAKINSTNIAAKLILGLLSAPPRVKTLYVDNCNNVDDMLDALTFDLNIGTHSCVLFYSEKSGTVLYCNGDYDSTQLEVSEGVIYVFTGQENTFTITQYDIHSFRKLLLEGVE